MMESDGAADDAPGFGRPEVSDGGTVSELGTWLDARRPTPPADLRRRVEETVTTALRSSAEGAHHEDAPSGHRGDPSGSDGGEGSAGRPATDAWAEARVEQLMGGARKSLAAAVARPGRVRESAFELLVADALVTYACEAALETERPVEALERIVEVGRTR
ncbi:MAG: hypothetical protein R3253_05520 [Longimicrobiales bacterium]|nr:hypothetical protein [Longimicrobiales bacterium]